MFSVQCCLCIISASRLDRHPAVVNARMRVAVFLFRSLIAAAGADDDDALHVVPHEKLFVKLHALWHSWCTVAVD